MAKYRYLVDRPAGGIMYRGDEFMTNIHFTNRTYHAWQYKRGIDDSVGEDWVEKRDLDELTVEQARAFAKRVGITAPIE